MARLDLTDFEWSVIEPLLPTKVRGVARNASVADWLIGAGHVSTSYTASQGTRLGRLGRIYIEKPDGGPIWVGGNTQTLFSGTTGTDAI